MDDIFRTNLENAINESGLTNAEIARRIGVGRSTITQWLKGVSSPTQSKIVKIAVTLNKEPSWFFIDNTKKQRVINNLTDKQLTLAMSVDPDITDEQLQQAINYVRFMKEQEDKKNDTNGKN
ncbi:helix-turn-helix domain-containing protein [Oenococcus oeni]|uniref:helix-turn-helix domain-containing protein n=1 Tax=Oenococcus oeni TaxID=1247 RepID=UPI001648C611|nr:helix-turn-helix transcriptional regulator [Oenococcus oeni]